MVSPGFALMVGPTIGPTLGKIDLILDEGRAIFGAVPPRPGSNDDYAVVRLAEPVLIWPVLSATVCSS